MDALPAEILQEIVSYLFEPDLNSLRLVNHNLSAAATIFKFQALHVRKTRRGLENLLNVSRQPELARCVREITYPHRHLVPTRQRGRSSPFWPYELCTMRFCDWYREKYVAQIELENSGQCVPALKSSLSRMANKLCGKWFETLPETEMTIIPLEYHYWSMKIWDIIVKRGVFQPDEPEEAMKAFTDLVITMSRLKFKLDRFEGRSGWLCRGFFSNSSGLWSYASLFQNLTRAYIRFTTLYNSKGRKAFKKDAKEGQIFKFLSLAPDLRMLSLEIESDGRLKEFPLLDILSRGYVWKHLHTFNLSTFCAVKAEDLVEFLGRYARILKCLYFSFELYGTWREVLDFVKERLHLTV
ncbi:hypothetical protein RUND412_003927 [Rhizina undulata]